ncbi:RIP metalloprotease RseP [Membranihabitans maritimus]|uniref:RIP metalloprotease RseP n=1 Tax=Membranihabitans maritimus TaxID=2904244 RepID=UPI001EFFCDA4|nr:RIP metalloprotease RseP [Membranihabitans maritimus]
MGIMIAQFALSLSLLIVLHEMGHFFPAKWFKTRVEKFYLFFDPWFSIFKKKFGDTEYGIGWLPLGGYVKISGMVDESMDTEALKEPPKPWEFRSKPAWQRLIIMLGGVTVNFILGFLIFGLMLWQYGSEYLPTSELKYGLQVDSIAQEMGLQNGDKILSIGDVKFERYNPGVIRSEIAINNATTMEIERGGAQQTLQIDPRFTKVLTSYEYKDAYLVAPRMPVKIGKIVKGSNAEDAGLKVDDQITKINGVETAFFDQFYSEIREHKGEDIELTVLREGNEVEVEAEVSDEGTLGFQNYGMDHFFSFATEKYSLGKALPMGVVQGWDFIMTQVKAFGQMFRGKIKASDSLGGFATISKLFPEEWNWQIFWRNTAILSLILGFMNLLPIPALDGGHVMFLLIEMVTGRKPSDKVLEYATIIGFILVMGLVLFANGLDVWRWLKG